ncbi:unnamed protein product [Penicillium salamii]|uniref:Uncharacterized protein n=1 Tax=Penicillium salamii TaxID=1612424 RepID=A0A9W4JIX5_9EURO|nr:unnamed protein product [Penicillium salamii]CAG8138846.1 unnamed protein product [Penicillium salamii]CAG8156006.1 unnamed protein product [Penicillium salamii]CAG8157113.1 unnamed protein product [Penicillium salamii]CAG8158040.1 unnamed protein product [Penicillium salamii]
MHLDHKIPWQTASSHYELLRKSPSFPIRTDMFVRRLRTQLNDLNHFTRVLINTIHEFSTTEREKYPGIAEEPALSKELFSAELLTYAERKFGLGQHTTNSVEHNPLSAEYQHLSHWIDRAEDWEEGGLHYSTGHADLADAVKMLIIIASSVSGDSSDEEKNLEKQAMTALLRLSQHSQVPLSDLDSLHWGHSFGVNHVAEFALEIYLLLNIVDGVLARDDQGTGLGNHVSMLEMDSFERFTRKALCDYDYPAQNIPHRRFWNAHGVDDDWAAWSFNPDEECVTGTERAAVTDPLTRREGVAPEVRSGLKEYLKMCFGLMYRYDVLLREWYGEKVADEYWEETILRTLCKLGGANRLG